MGALEGSNTTSQPPLPISSVHPSVSSGHATGLAWSAHRLTAIPRDGEWQISCVRSVARAISKPRHTIASSHWTYEVTGEVRNLTRRKSTELSQSKMSFGCSTN